MLFASPINRPQLYAPLDLDNDGCWWSTLEYSELYRPSIELSGFLHVICYLQCSSYVTWSLHLLELIALIIVPRLKDNGKRLHGHLHCYLCDTSLSHPGDS